MRTIWFNTLMLVLMLGGLSVTSVAEAADSTQSAPPKVGWNKPSAKRAESAEQADSATYATKSGEANSAVTATTATTATTVDAQALTGIPTCASGSVLTNTNGSWSCVQLVSAAGTFAGQCRQWVNYSGGYPGDGQSYSSSLMCWGAAVPQGNSDGYYAICTGGTLRCNGGYFCHGSSCSYCRASNYDCLN